MVTGTPAERQARADTSDWIKAGALGGLVAGLVFAMFEMIMAAILNSSDAFFMPLRMIGAIVLGEQALMPTYGLATAAVVGLIVHMMLSIIFGIAFGVIVALIPALAQSTGALLVSASAYGLLIWLVNFYIIARLAGWPWFPDQTNPAVQFVAHTFFYGTILGWLVHRNVAPEQPR
jgi:uncharacterized membrane protein YagU involved in acid resistance